jgi:hypothetical protein
LQLAASDEVAGVEVVRRVDHDLTVPFESPDGLRDAGQRTAMTTMPAADA